MFHTRLCASLWQKVPQPTPLQQFSRLITRKRWTQQQVADVQHFQAVSEALYGPVLPQSQYAYIHKPTITRHQHGKHSDKKVVVDFPAKPLEKQTKYLAEQEQTSKTDGVSPTAHVQWTNTLLHVPTKKVSNVDFGNVVAASASSESLVTSVKCVERKPPQTRDASECQNVLIDSVDLLHFPMLPSNAESSSVEKYVHSIVGGSRLPSVGTILRDTMSPEAKAVLDNWMKRKILEMGEAGFQKYKQELLTNGQNFHECVAAFLKGAPDIPLNSANNDLWSSVEHVFPNVTDVELVETSVKHPVLGYMGVFDCLAFYKGQLCVIDWKTADKPKAKLEYTYDNPLQLAAYIGALNYDANFTHKIDRALLVIAYRDGKPAHVHEMSPSICLEYWHMWLARLQEFWKMKALAMKMRQTS